LATCTVGQLFPNQALPCPRSLAATAARPHREDRPRPMDFNSSTNDDSDSEDADQLANHEVEPSITVHAVTTAAENEVNVEVSPAADLAEGTAVSPAADQTMAAGTAAPASDSICGHPSERRHADASGSDSIPVPQTLCSRNMCPCGYIYRHAAGLASHMRNCRSGAQQDKHAEMPVEDHSANSNSGNGDEGRRSLHSQVLPAHMCGTGTGEPRHKVPTTAGSCVCTQQTTVHTVFVGWCASPPTLLILQPTSLCVRLTPPQHMYNCTIPMCNSARLLAWRESHVSAPHAVSLQKIGEAHCSS